MAPSQTLKFSLIVCFLLVLARIAWGEDIIYLKNGMSFIGKVIRADEGTIELKTLKGKVSIPRAEVDRIAYDKAPSPQKERKSQALSRKGWLKRGIACQEGRQFKEAVINFEKLLRIDPANWEGWLELGICRAELKQYPRAIKGFKEVVRLRPEWSRGYYYLASYLYHTDEISQGIKFAKTAIIREPDFAPAHFVLGLLLEKNKQTNLAIKEYRLARALAPESSTATESAERLAELTRKAVRSTPLSKPLPPAE